MAEDQTPAKHSKLIKTSFSLQEELLATQESCLTPVHNQIDSQYSNASFIIIKYSFLSQLKVMLKKHDFDCQVLTPFGHLDLIGAQFTAVVYHNHPFSQLLPTLRNHPDFMFDGRQTAVCPVTDMIQLYTRNGKRMLPKADFDTLQIWAEKELREEKIKISLWRYINEEKQTQVYLKTGSRLCTALLFLVMNNQNEKARLRNPKDMSKAQCIIKAN